MFPRNAKKGAKKSLFVADNTEDNLDALVGEQSTDKAGVAIGKKSKRVAPMVPTPE